MTKIVELAHLHSIIKSLKKENKKIVLTTGVFDVFHRAHSQFLTYAKKLGDILIVGLETDERVKKIKGPDRPKHTLEKRLTHLALENSVDYVFALPQEFNSPLDHENFIKMICPDIFAVSSHSPHQDKKRALIEKYGGKLVIAMEQDPSISTSQLLQQEK